MDQDHDEKQATQIDYPGRFGDMMRVAREKAGYSVEWVAMSTRISFQFVQAMEDGRLEDLPGEVFGRGFIRNLCKIYNEDEKLFLDAYEEAVEFSSGSPYQEKKVRAENLVRLNNRDKKNIFEFKWLKPLFGLKYNGIYFISAFSAVLVGMIGYLAYDHLASDSIAVEVNEIVEANIPSEKVETSQKTSEIQQRKKSSNNIQNEQQIKLAKPLPIDIGLAPNASLDRNIVEILAKEKVKIRYLSDGSRWNTRLLDPQNHRLIFEKSAELLIFDAAAVSLTYNGKKLGSLGRKGRIRKLSFE